MKIWMRRKYSRVVFNAGIISIRRMCSHKDNTVLLVIKEHRALFQSGLSPSARPSVQVEVVFELEVHRNGTAVLLRWREPNLPRRRYRLLR